MQPLSTRWRVSLVMLQLTLLAGCVDGPLRRPPPFDATSPVRTPPEIQHAFNKNKDDFAAILARENIGGKVVVSITVEPDGSVSDCHTVTSNFSPKTNAQVVEEVKEMNFGSRDVPAFTFPNYPINYLH